MRGGILHGDDVGLEQAQNHRDRHLFDVWSGPERQAGEGRRSSVAGFQKDLPRQHRLDQHSGQDDDEEEHGPSDDEGAIPDGKQL